MITKETARRIYNCYTQIEAVDKLKKDMCEEVRKNREREDAQRQKAFTEPIPANNFGRFGNGLQLGVPEYPGTSMRLFNISPEIGIKVMDEHKKALLDEMETLKAIANIEMSSDEQ